MRTWDLDSAGVLVLPSGRRVRGRGLSAALPEGPEPTFGLYLQGSAPPPVGWESEWVRWRDFRLPTDPVALRASLERALQRSAEDRVEIACTGGFGRTGTALACLAILDGLPAADAVDYVRAGYRPKAVETPGQRRFVARFSVSGDSHTPRR